MTKAFNLTNDTQMLFDSYTTPIYSVVYGYCEENNLMGELFKNCRENTLLEFYKKLPIIEGSRSISCGNWSATNDTTLKHPNKPA